MPIRDGSTNGKQSSSGNRLRTARASGPQTERPFGVVERRATMLDVDHGRKSPGTPGKREIPRDPPAVAHVRDSAESPLGDLSVARLSALARAETGDQFEHGWNGSLGVHVVPRRKRRSVARGRYAAQRPVARAAALWGHPAFAWAWFRTWPPGGGSSFTRRSGDAADPGVGSGTLRDPPVTSGVSARGGKTLRRRAPQGLGADPGLLGFYAPPVWRRRRHHLAAASSRDHRERL